MHLRGSRIALQQRRALLLGPLHRVDVRALTPG
jgi:hypothetical protein